MSQHWLTTDSNAGKVTVLCGWDRPLQGYHLTVFSAEDPDEILYSNLDEPVPHPADFSAFVPALAALGISLPAAMRAEILSDGENDTGNKIVRHG